jgi:hypothetical protein
MEALNYEKTFSFTGAKKLFLEMDQY